MAQQPGNKGQKESEVKKRVEDCHKSNYSYVTMEEGSYVGELAPDGLPNLNLGIGPDLIKDRQSGGGTVFYGEGNKIIQLANETFGFNGWSTTIRQFTIDYMDCDDRGKCDIAAAAIIRVTLRDGMHREDIGYGHSQNVQKGAAFEKVRKECVTDGIKRALRQFGGIFISAYDAEHMKNVKKNFRSKPRPITLESLYSGNADIFEKKSNAQMEQEKKQMREGKPPPAPRPQTGQMGPPPPQPPAPVPAPAPAPAPAPVPAPAAVPEPMVVDRLPSSPPNEDWDDMFDAAAREGLTHNINQDLLPSDDFDDLDKLMDQRAEERNTTTTTTEEYNPINEKNQDTLLHFTSASQAEKQKNLEGAEKFDTNTPDRFSRKKSMPIRRTILPDHPNATSPSLSQSQAIEGSQFAKPNTPLVRKRGTPVANQSSNTNAQPDASKRQRVTPPAN